MKLAALAFLFPVSAYAGMGSCYQVPAGVTQPAGAIAVKANCLALYENFTSNANIDTGATDAPGYGWYPGNTAHNWFGYPQLPTSDWTTGANGLAITTQPKPGGMGLQSTALVDNSTGAYVGRVFQAPFDYQIQTTIDTFQAPGGTGTAPCGVGGANVTRYSWPALWLQDVLLTYQQSISGGTLPSNRSEIDVTEASLSGGCTGGTFANILQNVHYWTSWNGYNTGFSGTISPTGWNGSTYHAVEVVAKRRVDGGGTGSVTFSVDGAQTNQTTWTDLTGVGAVENSTYMLFHNPGINWAQKVASEEMWTQ